MDLSYTQNLEDYHLALAFAGQATGTYIDIGAGHPIADNVSFWFYERGWRGVVVEPQSELAALYARLRPRDTAVRALIGRDNGESDFFLVDRLHGFSSTVEEHAKQALAHGAHYRKLRLPAMTLATLCETHKLSGIDFLKIDVEGGEADVLAGADFKRFRPKVIVAEAVAPGSGEPAWEAWEPLLIANDTEDLTIQSIFPEDVEAALTKLANCFTDVIVKHVNDPPTCSLQLRDKVALIQRVYRENPKAAEAVKEQIRKDPTSKVFDVEHMRARSYVHIQEINQHMQDFRVLCATTSKDSERMWTRYAQDHRGIVLRIQPNVAKDSKFQLFRPVQYRASRPPLYDDTLSFLEGSLFGDQLAKIREIMDKIVYWKTLEWEYECEYRLAIPVREGEDWNTLAYHPEEITELYLGLAMTKENRDEIIGKAKAVNPNIAILQTSRGANQTLTFQKL